MTRVGVLAPGSDGTAKVVAQLGDARAHPQGARSPDRAPGGAAHLRGGSRRPRRGELDAGARDRRRARRRVLHGVRERRADRQAAAARARRVGLDDGRPGRRRAGPDAAGRLGGARPRDGGDRDAVRDGRLLRRRRRLEARPWRLPARDGLTPLAISPRQRLDDAVRDGVATCRSAAPTARCRCCTRSTREREIDTFVIYTDSETWAGDIHPAQALSDYRRASGIDARLVVVGMVSNGFSIADPARPGDARRRRLRHRDAAADLRLRPRRSLTRRAPPGVLRHAERR